MSQKMAKWVNPKLYPSTKAINRLAKTVRINFFGTLESKQYLQPGECLMMNAAVEFQGETGIFNILTMAPYPVQQQACDISPHSWCRLLVPEGAIWTYSKRTVWLYALSSLVTP